MKKLFLTGGTSGIGYSILEKFSDNGWRVFSTFNKNKIQTNLLKKKFLNCKFIKLDLYSKKSIDQATSKIPGKLDAIILNASDTMFVPKEKFKKLTPLLFEKYVSINLLSQYRIIYNLMPKLNKNSNIILISSIASKNGIGSNVAYSASKAALNNLAKSLTNIFGEKIQINCIAPGLMKTKFTSKFSEKYFKNYKLKTPTKKLTTPDNVAAVSISLCLNFKNFSGQTIFLDGGSS
ncbi:SDR family oxidoreductase [Candidatus Pelagibacter sp. HIMB1623]|uniref:SDR family oxidoreductase n=1 Tax=Candidatus Pelagibacter sp. HIMB1623 TaxID=3413358 RepID=UPI003F854190